MTARLIIVRHGNTFDKGDVVTRVGGRTDIPLSVSGRAQAESLAGHFSATSLDSARSGPLKRRSATSFRAASVQIRITFLDAGRSFW